MNLIKIFISVILAILTLGGSLIVYAENKFSTKEMVQLLDLNQKTENKYIREDIREIKQDVKYIRNRLEKI